MITLLPFIGCEKSTYEPSFEDITYQFTSNVNGMYNVAYTESEGVLNNVTFVGTIWTKTVKSDGIKRPYIIKVSPYNSDGFNSTLKIVVGNKVVKERTFNSVLSPTIQYN